MQNSARFIGLQSLDLVGIVVPDSAPELQLEIVSRKNPDSVKSGGATGVICK